MKRCKCGCGKYIKSGDYSRGHNPNSYWNTGLTKETDERVKQNGNKIREARIKLIEEGKIKPPFPKGSKNHPMKNPVIAKKVSKAKKRLFKEGKLKTLFVKGNKVSLGLYRTKEVNKNQSKRLKKEYAEGIRKPYWLGKKQSGCTKRKRSKSIKKLWENEKYAENWCKKNNIKPNKPEILLNKLLQENFPNQFKYTGDGKFWIKRFNPDFINTKNKGVIEMFGDYWHNLPEHKERDKERLKVYKEEGFATLVLWEHELKHPIQVINKVGGFINE